ncbi:12134_t:CDS:2 [Cetraspora pellucida]|uniref:12134_t:CDS:1 n=1 Tax=Cetraspora pellucida TaxID=1433469 RepID=A0A9N9G0H4_9GLOM|nr:12134_t:CDS:2 [Cetraspora pellucida]
METNMSSHKVFNDNALLKLKINVSYSQVTKENTIGNVTKAFLFRLSVNKNSNELMQENVQDLDLIKYLLAPYYDIDYSCISSQRIGYENYNISKLRKRKKEVSPNNIDKYLRKHIKKYYSRKHIKKYYSRKHIKKYYSNKSETQTFASSNNVMSGLDSQYVKQKDSSNPAPSKKHAGEPTLADKSTSKKAKKESHVLNELIKELSTELETPQAPIVRKENAINFDDLYNNITNAKT